jgi:hypothetical protein
MMFLGKSEGWMGVAGWEEEGGGGGRWGWHYK